MCPIVAAGLVGGSIVAGTALSINSSIQTGRFQKDMANYQAKLNRNRAILASQSGETQAQQESLRRRQLGATGKTSFAQNGMILNDSPTSAPSMWEQDQAAQLAFDRQIILDNAESSAWGFSENAKAEIAQGSMARSSGTMNAYAAGFSGTAQLGQTYLMYKSATNNNGGK